MFNIFFFLVFVLFVPADFEQRYEAVGWWCLSAGLRYFQI